MNAQWFSGVVIRGLQNGKKFGFPTANIQLQDDRIPDTGVYAVQVTVAGKLYYGMLYVGTRPTLHLAKISVEINIFDFSEDIYDEHIEFQILKKIREDIPFPNVTELIRQIEKDKQEILHFLHE